MPGKNAKKVGFPKVLKNLISSLSKSWGTFSSGGLGPVKQPYFYIYRLLAPIVLNFQHCINHARLGCLRNFADTEFRVFYSVYFIYYSKVQKKYVKN